MPTCEMRPPVGKSGPVTCCIMPSRPMCGSSIRASRPLQISVRLCGGMFVAMPTAMPDAPLISRFGTAEGSTLGSTVVSS